MQRLNAKKGSVGVRKVPNEYVLLHQQAQGGYKQLNVIPIFLPNCFAPATITRLNFQVIASVRVLASGSNLVLVTCLQGSFGCALRIKRDGPGDAALVVKVLDITQDSYKWVMREICFGYHLAKSCHPNMARLLHHYVSPNSDPPNNEFSAGSCVYFVQDDCGKSLIQ